MKGIVALVGRPNVGKSTLFNRLLGEKKAIVDRLPNVTRDRNYGLVNWNGVEFLLMDTGGFEPTAKTGLLAQIKEQTQLAIEEAHAIVFLTDGKEGLTATDHEIYQILRRSEKPVFCAVNKVDNPSSQDKVYEFYQLGVDRLYSISAIHNLGLHSLIKELIKSLPSQQDEASSQEEPCKIAILGRPNVGKSSLINRILNEERMLVNEMPGTTRDAVDIPFKFKGKDFLLVDTAGIRRKSRISLRLEKYSIISALKALDRCHIALILIDATEGVAEQDAKIAGIAHNRGKASIIVVNKWDLVEKSNSTARRYEEEIRSNIKFLHYAPLAFVSAKTGQRVMKIMDLVEKVEKGYRKRIGTAELNRFFEIVVRNHEPPSYKGKKVKLNYIAQVSTAPPTFVIFTNLPEGIHFSYERYLMNCLRQAYGFQGVPLRIWFRKK